MHRVALLRRPGVGRSNLLVGAGAAFDLFHRQSVSRPLVRPFNAKDAKSLQPSGRLVKDVRRHFGQVSRRLWCPHRAGWLVFSGVISPIRAANFFDFRKDARIGHFYPSELTA